MAGRKGAREAQHGGRRLTKIFTSFDDLLSAIQNEANQTEHIINTKVSRAKYLLDQKIKLEKKLAAINAELAAMKEDA